MNYELEGKAEHKVQSNIEFKLTVTKSGSPCEPNADIVGWLKGVNEDIRGNVHKSFGLVRINFHVGTPGAYELHIEVNKKRLYEPSVIKVVESHLQHYEDFRFEITSEVFNGGRVDTEYTVKIAARKDNQLKDVNESDLFLRVGGPHELQVIPARRAGQGHYTCRFAAKVPGFHPIDVWYEGKSVIAKPERVHFISPSNAAQTKAVKVPTGYETVGQVTTFTIQSRNSSGVNNTSGGDNFDVQSSGPAQLADLIIRDMLDGKYNVSFTPTQTGTYELDISLNGLPIGNSPVKITAIRK